MSSIQNRQMLVGFATILRMLALAGLVPVVTSFSTSHAAFPGANGKIVFESNRDGFSHIYVMNPDGSGQDPLTSTAAIDGSPEWSADGTKIVFSSTRDGNHEIYVMKCDGSEQDRLTTDLAVDIVPTWSPDGTKIAFTSRRDGNEEIYVMNANGTGQTNLTNDPAGDAQPAWSPDGTKIAFESHRNGLPQIFVMNTNGTGVTPLTSVGSNGGAAWSPDGTKIAFHSNRTSTFDIYVMNTDGTGQTRLAFDPVYATNPAWSPDGAKIIFESQRNGNYEVYVMDDDGTGQMNLTNHSAFDAQPNWQPINNQAPSANAGGPYSVNEGGSVVVIASGSDPECGALTFAWDLDNNGSFETPGQSVTFSAAGLDGPDSRTIAVQVSDSGGLKATAQAAVNVLNVAPTGVTAGAVTINENDTATVNGSFTDPGTLDTHTVVINWGLGEGSTTLTLAAGVLTFSASHQYLDDNPTGTPSDTYSVSITVTDDDTGVGTGSSSVTVNNVLPSNVSASSSAPSLNENDTATLSGSFTDPGTLDTHTVVINWGDGSSNTTLSLAAGVLTFSTPHQYLDDNPTGTPSDVNTITVIVTDDDTGSGSGTSSVTVNNVVPLIVSVTGPSSPLALGSSASVTANFTNVGSQDTHTCTFSWDDSTSSSGSVTESGGNGSCTASHTYAAAGVYTVGATVKDDDTGSASQNFEFIVIYDPSAGFVTGGGWIMSPSGACKLSWCTDSTTGRANFGFVSKYKKGATIPTGETEFQFQAGNLNFHSDSYQWLVVSGCKAQYKGSGTINGVSGYGFLLTAYDAQAGSGGSCSGSTADRFRIKVWRLSDSVIVYDNRMSVSDDIDNTDPQAISGGSVVVHK